MAGRATPLASGLADYNKFEEAKQLGFELFAGPFYASRHKAAVRKVPVGEMGTLVALAALQGQSATIEDLEQVIDRDVGLSVKLLRYINSAYVGHARQHRLDPPGGDDARLARRVALGAAGRADRRPEHAPGAVGRWG